MTVGNPDQYQDALVANRGQTQLGNQFSYVGARTGQQEMLRVPTIGLASSILVINVAVGYTFGGN